MEATRNQIIIFKEKCDFSHSTLESVECNMTDLLKAREGESKCGLDSASMSLESESQLEWNENVKCICDLEMNIRLETDVIKSDILANLKGNYRRLVVGD